MDNTEDKNNNGNQYPNDPAGIAARTDSKSDMMPDEHPRDGFDTTLPADDGLINSKAPGNDTNSQNESGDAVDDSTRNNFLSDNPSNNAPEGDRERQPDNTDTTNS